MYQLHMRETFEQLAWEDLTIEQKQQILESHLFLNLKRDGKIKGRTVAGGNRQRQFFQKEDATSSTVATVRNTSLCKFRMSFGTGTMISIIGNGLFLAFSLSGVQHPYHGCVDQYHQLGSGSWKCVHSGP
jgi:hypothetical protein